MRDTIKLTRKQFENVIEEAISYSRAGGQQFNPSTCSTLMIEQVNDIIIEKKPLREATMNRIKKWLENTECAFISAWRERLDDATNFTSTLENGNGGYTWNGSAIEYNKQFRPRLKDKRTDKGYNHKEGKYPNLHVFSKEENMERNRILKAKLLTKGCGVIDIKGVYPEGMKGENCEESFLVFNIKNNQNFYNEIFALSELFNQDSFYYKPLDSVYGCLIGTNNNGFPGYGQQGPRSKFVEDVCSNYMSRFQNKPFSFVQDDAVKYNSREEAMNDKSVDDYRQKVWPNDGNKTFADRKAERSKSYVGQIQETKNNRIRTIEDYQFKTRMVIAEYANRI